MSESDEILAANEGFYSAFSARDMSAMEDVWAKEVPVSCIHPGWNVLTGRDRVMESWHAILDNSDAPRIRCYEPEINRVGEIALVTCYEAVEAGILAATNIFVPEAGGWKMVHHQASPTAQPPETAPAGSENTVH